MDLHHLLLAGLPAHSGLPPEADTVTAGRHVSKVPIPDIQVYAAVRSWQDSAQPKALCVDLVHEDEWNSMRCFAFYGKMAKVTLARRFRRGHAWQAISQNLRRDATMSRVKQASKQKRTTKTAAAKVLGAAGLSFSLVGSASASTMPTAGIPQSDNTSPNQRFVLDEEEMVDVSLATFYVFDRENVGSGVQLARGCGGGGGCGHGGGGCGGCGHGGGGCGHVGGGCGHGGGGCVGLRG